MDSSPATEDYELWVLLHQTRDAIYKAREKEVQVHGLTPIKAATVFIIRAIGDKATPAEIARWLLREPNSVTELLDRMAKDGLVKKTRDLEKKNQVRITLTEKGQQAFEQSREHKSVQQILSALSGEEKKQMRLLLEKLRARALAELDIKYQLPYP